MPRLALVPDALALDNEDMVSRTEVTARNIGILDIGFRLPRHLGHWMLVSESIWILDIGFRKHLDIGYWIPKAWYVYGLYGIKGMTQLTSTRLL